MASVAIRRRVSPFILLGCLGLTLLGVGIAGLTAKDDKPAVPADLALVPADALGFARFNVAGVWQMDITQTLFKSLLGGAQGFNPDEEFAKRFGFGFKDLSHLTIIYLNPTGNSEGFPGGEIITNGAILLTTAKPYDKAHIQKVLLAGSPEEKYKGKAYYIADQDGPRTSVLHFVSERTILLCFRQAFQRIVDGSTDKELPAGLQAGIRLASENHHIVGALHVPDGVAQALLQEKLPGAAQAYKPLLEARSVTLTVDFAGESKMNVDVHFADAAKAKKGHEAANLGLTTLRLLSGPAIAEMRSGIKSADFEKLTKEGYAALQTSTATLKDNNVQIALKMKTDLPLINAAFADIAKLQGGVANASARANSANNMKQIMLAMHNYHGAEGSFPPAAIYGKDGKPLLSWRVAILPYIEQDALYKQFHLNEPWDSEHNKKLLSVIVRVYAPVGDVKPKEPGMTFYQVFTGKGTCFQGEDGVRLQDVKDGTSNTIALVEAGEAVPWTKPVDLVYDAKKPLPKLGGLFKEGFNAAFCDGSVRFIAAKFDENLFRKFITIAGGETVDFGKLNP